MTTDNPEMPERLWAVEDEEHEIHWWIDPDEGGTEYVRADLCRPDRSPAGEVRVKPLEWRETTYGAWDQPAWLSEQYRITFDRAGFNLECDGSAIGDSYPSLASAQDEAQRNWSAHILAALSPSPAPEREGLVERMAKAIYESQRDRHPHPETWTAWSDETYPGYFDPWREQARAALAAYEGERKDG